MAGKNESLYSFTRKKKLYTKLSIRRSRNNVPFASPAKCTTCWIILYIISQYSRCSLDNHAADRAVLRKLCPFFGNLIDWSENNGNSVAQEERTVGKNRPLHKLWHRKPCEKNNMSHTGDGATPCTVDFMRVPLASAILKDTHIHIRAAMIDRPEMKSNEYIFICTLMGRSPLTPIHNNK